VIRAGDLVFIDTGAFIAAAVVADNHHEEAAAIWDELLAKGAKSVTSVLMKKHKLRRAFTFDAHFSAAGFKILHV
jgi:predicted nucleic acid-binding protein